MEPAEPSAVSSPAGSTRTTCSRGTSRKPDGARSKIEDSFISVLKRRPTQQELVISRQLVSNLDEDQDVDDESVWAILCQGLMISNEFLYLR